MSERGRVNAFVWRTWQNATQSEKGRRGAYCGKRAQMVCALVLWALACGLKFRVVWAFLPSGRALVWGKGLALNVARFWGFGRVAICGSSKGSEADATHPYWRRRREMGALPLPSEFWKFCRKVLTSGWGCVTMGVARRVRGALRENGKRGKEEMRTSGKREMRGLAFLGIAIVMAVALCIASLVSGNVFSMVFSILLVGTLCVGLGYQYCKHEDEVEAYFAEGARKREESYKAETIMAKHIEAIKVAATEPKLEGEKEVGEVDDAN